MGRRWRQITMSMVGALFLVSSLMSSSAGAADLAGRVRIVEKGKEKTSREARFAVVYYQPAEPTDLAVPEQPFELVTVRKQFQPRVLAVPVGATVLFPNEDPILHNVFSVSGKNRFDLGLYRKGDEGKSHTFEHSGIVRVFCNVHHSMVAYIAVLDTPHHTNLARDGSFSLRGVPSGKGKLTVWHERADPVTIEVEAGARSPLDIELTITKPRVPQHRNKFGKPYSRKRRGKAY